MNKNNGRGSWARRGSWLLPVSWALGTGVAVAAEPGFAGPSPQPQATLDEVVVTGIRASLERSLDIKRESGIVLDSINATELGRFPDDDVADSLSHLPGITLTRTTGGEGQKVNVRGLGPQYNIVTLNNRQLATDDDGRDLAFDVLPSEVISGADVLKSTQASALEGSIGGTVNLRTASPFDNPGLHAGAQGVSGILCDSGRMIIDTSRTDHRTAMRTALVPHAIPSPASSNLWSPLATAAISASLQPRRSESGHGL